MGVLFDFRNIDWVSVVCMVLGWVFRNREGSESGWLTGFYFEFISILR